VFFYLIKLLFSGFLPFKRNFVCGQNNSKYRDWAPLNSHYLVWTKENWIMEMNYHLHLRQFKEIQSENLAMYLSETEDVEQQN